MFVCLFVRQGQRSIFLSVGVGMSGRPIIGPGTTPFDCNKAPFLNIKIHPILDRIGYLLYDVIHGQKEGG